MKWYCHYRISVANEIRINTEIRVWLWVAALSNFLQNSVTYVRKTTTFRNSGQLKSKHSKVLKSCSIFEVNSRDLPFLKILHSQIMFMQRGVLRREILVQFDINYDVQQSPRNIFCPCKQNINLASFIFDVACPKVCHSLREEVPNDKAHTCKEH